MTEGEAIQIAPAKLLRQLTCGKIHENYRAMLLEEGVEKFKEVSHALRLSNKPPESIKRERAFRGKWWQFVAAIQINQFRHGPQTIPRPYDRSRRSFR